MTIGFLGYGRMGKAIEELAVAAGHEVALRVDSQNLELRSPDNLAQCDVILEFTRPESAVENIMACFEAGVPVVSGTTGWLDQMPEVLGMCSDKDGALFYASNFSIGVNIFFALNHYLAQLIRDLPQYHASMTEIHHIHKKDAPSGTAITLANSIIQETPGLNSWTLEENPEPGQLPIRSIREGEIPGTHQIRFASEVDTLELTHTAHSRRGFAEGALLAAEWIPGKQGYYEMSDLLGWRKKRSLRSEDA